MNRLHNLAVRMKKGDRRAAGALYDELAPKVHGFVFARTGRREIAEDLSQDVFLKLIEKIETFDPQKGSFVAWFWRLVRNTLIDHFRSSTRLVPSWIEGLTTGEKKEVPFSAFEGEDLDRLASYMAHGNVDAKLMYEKLQRFLGTCSEDERQVFELRYVAELSYGEMAEVVGKSEGALRVAALRVKEKIKKELTYEIQ